MGKCLSLLIFFKAVHFVADPSDYPRVKVIDDGGGQEEYCVFAHKREWKGRLAKIVIHLIENAFADSSFVVNADNLILRMFPVVRQDAAVFVICFEEGFGTVYYLAQYDELEALDVGKVGKVDRTNVLPTFPLLFFQLFGQICWPHGKFHQS